MLSRRFRVVLQLFRGRWFTLIPFAVPIDVVVGDPLELWAAPGVAELMPSRTHGGGIGGDGAGAVTDEAVEAAHALYCDALRGLFERNKERFEGYSRCRLVVS